jgi:hypothetical protein
MSIRMFFSVGLVALVTGCESVPPGVERGPHGTIAYDVLVESSPPGVRIAANGEDVGVTPLTLRIFGDKDGTFHDFGAYEYVVQAYPADTNQYLQTRVFQTGRMFTPQDTIPRQIFFEMHQPPARYVVPAYPPAYYAPPPHYYYYGPRYYHSPGIHIRPHFHHRHHFRR